MPSPPPVPDALPPAVDVAICGGGVAGLGLACALSALPRPAAAPPLSILVLERRAQAGGIHRGDSLLPRATRHLLGWGLGPGLLAAGARPIDAVRVHARGRQLLEGPVVPPGEDAPYYVLPHAEIERLLEARARAAGVRLVRRVGARGLLRGPGGRVEGVEVVGPDGVACPVRARLVVGADGQRSRVREALGLEVDVHDYDHALLSLEADRPADYRDGLEVHLHRDGGVLLLPRPPRADGSARVSVGVLVEAGQAALWHGLDDEALARAVAGRCPRLARAALDRQGMHVYALSRRHARAYVRDGAAILGDAAHVTSPVAGQGMTAALDDAGALAALVGPALLADRADGAPAALDRALAAWEGRQRPRTARLLRQAHALDRVYGARGPLAYRLQVAAAWLVGTPLGGWFGRGLARALLTERDPLPAPGPATAPPVEPAAPAAPPARAVARAHTQVQEVRAA